MSVHLEKLKEKLAELEPEVEKFYVKGVAKSAVAVRKVLQEIKLLTKEFREDVSTVKASRKTSKADA
jgi:outer membrane protein assembly factor BamD (BamD/ComL family)